MSRAVCWLLDKWYAVRAKYRTWVLFRAWPWRWLPASAKRRTP